MAPAVSPPDTGRANQSRPGCSLALPFWLIFFLLAVYLLSFSGRFHVMDELAVFTAGNSLAQHGRADINPLIWTNHWTPNPPGIWGNDGNLYTKKAPGISVITAPLIWLGHALPGLNAAHVGLLTNALVTALTAGCLFIWLVDLDFSRQAAGLTALAYGLCTFAWVYARMFWESSLLALCLLAAVWAAWRGTYPAYADHRLRWLLLSGLAAAAGLTLRFESVPAILLIGLYLTISPRQTAAHRRKAHGDEESPHDNQHSAANNFPMERNTQRARRSTQHDSEPRLLVGSFTFHVSRFTFHPSRLTLFLLPSVIAGLALLYFNLVRFGSLTETGYTQEMVFRRPWEGTLGLLFSPGVGLFIYAPILWLGFWGLRPVWRRLPRLYFWLVTLLCLFYWLFYGSWHAWGGTWGWGPRFLLAILPLLMLFVAGALERTTVLAWPGVALLVGVSLAINLLGILVDFNEHFLRLGSSSDFVFNWAHFPPLAHWQILQEGLVDLAWLRPEAGKITIAWIVLGPALVLVGLATVGLVVTWRQEVKAGKHPHDRAVEEAGRRLSLGAIQALFMGLLVGMTLVLTLVMMSGTARIALAGPQAEADLPVLATLAGQAQPGDVLLVAMPPFGDVQEVTTRLMSYLDRPLPTYAWIENGPRAIEPEERALMWPAALAGTKRVWLFERWLTQEDASNPTYRHLNQRAFPLWEGWFAGSGRLTLYALANEAQPAASASPNTPFAGGVTLVDFAVMAEAGDSGAVVEPGAVLKVRLTWRAAEGEALAAAEASAGPVTASVQLLNEAGQNVAQFDRLLVDLQKVDQSPLLPGQSVSTGYGLALPEKLPPGSYPLIVSLYRAASGQRLPLAGGSPDDFLYLTAVEVR